MKKQMMIGLSALMLLGFVGCKKAEEPPAEVPEVQKLAPEAMMDEYAKIAIENENDCAKAAEKLTEFLNTNTNEWLDYLNTQVKAAVEKGEKPDEVIDKVMSPSKDLKDKYDVFKCAKDEAMNAVTEKLASTIIEKLTQTAKDSIPKAAPIAAADLVGRWSIEKESDDIIPAIYTLKEDGTCLYKGMMDIDHRKCTFKVQSPDEAGGKLNKLVINVEADEIAPAFEKSDNIRLEGNELWFVSDATEWKFVKTKLEDIELTPYEKKPDERIPTPLGDDKKPAKYVEFVAPNEAATETKYVYREMDKSFTANYEKQLKKAGFKNNRPKGADPQYTKKIGKDFELTVEINKFDSGEIFIKMWATKFDP